MSHNGHGKLKVLLAEDDSGDQELARRALEPFAYESELIVVSDGQEALDYLICKDAESGSKMQPLPDVFLLDLNMPKVGGMEVLQSLRKNPRTRHLPIIVLTTSSDEADVSKCYHLGCSSFVTKPMDAMQYYKKVQGLATYWLDVVTLPSE